MPINWIFQGYLFLKIKHKSESFPLPSIYLYFGHCNVLFYLALITSSRRVSVSCPYLQLEGSIRISTTQTETLISHKNTSTCSSIWPQSPAKVTSVWHKVSASEFLSMHLSFSYFIFFLHMSNKTKMTQPFISFSSVIHAKALQLPVLLTGWIPGELLFWKNKQSIEQENSIQLPIPRLAYQQLSAQKSPGY